MPLQPSQGGRLRRPLRRSWGSRSSFLPLWRGCFRRRSSPRFPPPALSGGAASLPHAVLGRRGGGRRVLAGYWGSLTPVGPPSERGGGMVPAFFGCSVFSFSVPSSTIYRFGGLWWMRRTFGRTCICPSWRWMAALRRAGAGGKLRCAVPPRGRRIFAARWRPTRTGARSSSGGCTWRMPRFRPWSFRTRTFGCRSPCLGPWASMTGLLLVPIIGPWSPLLEAAASWAGLIWAYLGQF